MKYQKGWKELQRQDRKINLTTITVEIVGSIISAILLIAMLYMGLTF